MKWTVQQKWVNVFILVIGSVLDSNMSIQVILDHHACASHVVDYINKADRGMSDLQTSVVEILQEKSDMECWQILNVLGVKTLKLIEMLKLIKMPSQEAAWFLLKQDLSMKSRDIVYIRRLSEERTHGRKTKEQMCEENLDDSSTQVWELNILHRWEVDILDNKNYNTFYEQHLETIVDDVKKHTFGTDFEMIINMARFTIAAEEEPADRRKNDGPSMVPAFP
ncbi:hypothetical protein HPB47_026210 [Ixodes persulcatus]|uniref:Uncharacterized protein n=1 Tax=Ixodes persulcatus TaxID=34615 RepID=A0AC60Q1E0_IXOPE|nr:hypothetical protein HPB47_026210 [Ixodes persulcatus]